MRDPRISTRLALLSLLAVGFGRAGNSATADDTPPRPTVVVRAVHPDREVAAILDLFRGSRAADPAAALAAWKRATVEPKRLGKPAEALIAALNPRMLPEYRLLDEAEFAVTFDPWSPRGWEWRARVPHDDGTLADAGPTFALSGGAIEPPAGGVEVDRLAGAGSALLARGAAGLALASSRPQLDAALVAPALGPAAAPPIDSGWLIEVDPKAADTWTAPGGRRWAEAVRASRCESIAGRIRLVGATGLAIVNGRFGVPTPIVPPIDPAWLNPIPVDGTLAAFAFRVDPRAESWAALFGALDRVERADPAAAQAAPIRARVALAARVVGLRVEADLWPHLAGVAGWVGADGTGVDRAVLALHLDDETAAGRLIASLRGPRVRDGADDLVDVGPVRGRPLRVARRRLAVFVAWGDRAWPEAKAALDDPRRSARPALERSRTGDPPARVGALWPAQLPGVAPRSPLWGALAGGSPIRWSGHNKGDRTVDEFWAEGLDVTVRHFLDLIPQAPAPAP